jgi:hypothetical protein
MKKMRSIVGCFGMVALGLASSAWADRVGNGGVGVVCRTPKGQILSAQMLDIFEGKNMDANPLHYAENGMDLDTRIQLATVQMVPNSKFLADFLTELSKVKANVVVLPREDVGLTPTNDAFPALYKKGCAFEQVANYMADGKIRVDREIYRHLNELNRAALYVHEAVYAVARADAGETNSIRSRKLTAQVLAQNPDTGVVRALMTQLVTPLTPPVPQHPAAFNAIVPGAYRPENPNICEFEITKNEQTGEMFLIWHGSECEIVGKYVSLQCNDSSCSGQNGSKKDNCTVVMDNSCLGYRTCNGKQIRQWNTIFNISPISSRQIAYRLDLTDGTDTCSYSDPIVFHN